MQWVVYALGLAFLGMGLDIATWWKARQQRMRECVHRWEYRSVDNLDAGYERVCLDCPKRESVKRDDVPYHERAKRRNFRG